MGTQGHTLAHMWSWKQKMEDVARTNAVKEQALLVNQDNITWSEHLDSRVIHEIIVATYGHGSKRRSVDIPWMHLKEQAFRVKQRLTYK